MWSNASTTAIITDTFTSVGLVLAQVIGAVVVVVIGLMGVGYAIRLVRRHITGRKI